jgi:aminoglycoside phosphotransferase (APT) family kinase protein
MRSMISDEQATDLAFGLLDEKPQEVRRFGAGKFSETFAVTAGGGAYVLRIAPPDSLLQLFYELRMMRQEPGIHARLRAETTVPVPEIVAHDFTRARVDRDYLIMPRIPGRPLSEAELAPAAAARALEEWGRHVAAIHQLTDLEGRFGYLGEHRCMAPQPTWAEAFRTMYRKELDDVVACGVVEAGQADDAMALLEDHIDLFGHCAESRLLHGDLWVTNLLVEDNGRVTGVLDFDRACWGDIEWDLAIADYCGVTAPPFLAGYGATLDRHSGDAAIRRMFYLLYEHLKYVVISISTRRNDPPRARRYASECLAIMERFRRTGDPAF